MEKPLSMSLERIIAHLIGPPEGDKAGALSPAASRAVSQRLRMIVDGEGRAGGAESADRGRASDALKLAAYLDGSMAASERDAFEAELVRSPARRDELVAAAAWIDEIAARQEAPPADALARASALEDKVAAAPARPPGFSGMFEWLLPRPRLAIATSALASLAIVAVGIDIALHVSPQFRQAMQSQSAPVPGGSPSPRDGWQTPSAQGPASPAAPERPFLPQTPDDPIVLTAETINALIDYRNDPSPKRREDVLAALARAGGAPWAAEHVRTITVEPKLYERLTQPRGVLPTRVAARLSLDGALAVTIAD
jgi:hypothetical protein